MQTTTSVNYSGPNPLDFLLTDTLLPTRRTRSSMESMDRQVEIPRCQPPHIRHDSGRSRRNHLDPISPQLSPCRDVGLTFKLDSLMAKDDFSQDINLCCQRERLSSDTCLTSSDCLQSDHLLVSQELSYPGAAPSEPELCFSLGTSSAFNRDEKMKDTYSENVSTPLQQQDLISHLKPVDVAASVENPTPETGEPVKEKVRQQAPKKALKSKAAQMITHKVSRRKKSEEQVKYLRTLFFQLGGEWDGKVRKEAMQKTGLSRIQIYKWFFDMKLSLKPKEKVPALNERVSYPPSAIQTPSAELLETGDQPRPIFRVEKVVRA